MGDATGFGTGSPRTPHQDVGERTGSRAGCRSYRSQYFGNTLYMNPLRGFDNRTGIPPSTDMHPLSGMVVFGGVDVNL